MNNNSVTAITAITNLGFFILTSGKEYFVPFSDYPVFKNATVNDIYTFKMLSTKQVFWKKLDCDIELDALEDPGSFTLVYK